VSFAHPHIAPVIGKYFDIEIFDQHKSYDPSVHIPVVTYMQQHTNTWYRPLVDRGHKLIVDHLWDSDVDTLSQVVDGALVLRNPNWMWYNAHYEYCLYGHNNYQSERNWQHPFLLLMNMPRWHRDLIIERLADVLPQSLYSYKYQNKFIDNDVFDGDLRPWRCHYHPDWYNTTCFSVVAESYMRSSNWALHPESYKTEVSEKIFKPIIFRQPFVVYGSVDSLKYLHNQGFQTFPEWFDESYDDIVDDQHRFDAVTAVVIDAVNCYNNNEFVVDSALEEKLTYNHNRFFDTQLVASKFQNEIVHDIMSFIG
jgi:hypothetical protein